MSEKPVFIFVDEHIINISEINIISKTNENKTMIELKSGNTYIVDTSIERLKQAVQEASK